MSAMAQPSFTGMTAQATIARPKVSIGASRNSASAKVRMTRPPVVSKKKLLIASLPHPGPLPEGEGEESPLPWGEGWVRGWASRLAEALAQARQYLLAVQLEEARLVRPWCVEHQVVEAEAVIVGDLLHVLVRVGRDDPALRRALDRQGVGQPLHFARIVDRGFFLGRQGQRAPMLGVGQRALAVGVERDLDLDHHVVARRISA